MQLGHLSHHQKGREVVLLLPASTPTPLADLLFLPLFFKSGQGICLKLVLSVYQSQCIK